MFQSGIDDGLIGESPYIGKGRFRQDILARQRGQGDAEMEDMRRQHDELDRELDEKRKAIEKGKAWCVLLKVEWCMAIKRDIQLFTNIIVHSMFSG